MARLISVQPLGDGWTVRSDQIANEMIFRSGARAEQAARRLGERLAKTGAQCEIAVYARDGGLVGRFICAPPAPPLDRVSRFESALTV